MIRVASVAVLALALACESTEPEAPLPDLTGSYSLVSFTDNGLTEYPPRVIAVMGLSQHHIDDEWAIGQMTLNMRRQGHGGGTLTGGYAHNATGRMTVSLNGGLSGQFTLEGDTLITRMSVGTAADFSLRGEIVWVRLSES